MKNFSILRPIESTGCAALHPWFALSAALVVLALPVATVIAAPLHAWEKLEITLRAAKTYANPYTDTQVWVDLRGPGFARRCYGYWDGGDTFRVRVLATSPGTWTWTSGSSPEDSGLQGKNGEFTAVAWLEGERIENPNRRGFLRPTANGHALEYDDGTAFFYLADTWWSCSTWRYPWKGQTPKPQYVPGPGMGFEEAIQFRRHQGYNGVAVIAAYPSWQTEGPPEIKDAAGISLRRSWSVGNRCTLMPDESGHVPFHFPGKVPGFETIVPDMDRINPAYFRSLDRNMQYLSDQGFVPFFESIRRDQTTAWRQYYDWPGSFWRFLQYLVARYGCYNIIFSGIHADALGKPWLSGPEWNEVLTAHLQRYGPMPFVRLRSTNISGSTYRQYGHGSAAPWLTLHGVGNAPRDHRIFPLLEKMFQLPDPLPMLNNEPFYPHSANPQAAKVRGDQAANTRACAYGSVLNGALAGHVYGTQGYYLSGEDPRTGVQPYVWEALNGERFLEVGRQMAYLKDFILSEGKDYRDLVPDRASLAPNESAPGMEDWYLSGWSSLMRTADAGLLLAYFEVQSLRAQIKNLPAGARYQAQWFNPRTGGWGDASEGVLQVPGNGLLKVPEFPRGGNVANEDWALKLKRSTK